MRRRDFAARLTAMKHEAGELVSGAFTPCAECGMIVEDGAFHPFTACLLFKVSRDSHMVEENLAAVVEHGVRDEHARLREKVAAMRAKAQTLYDGSIAVEMIMKHRGKLDAYDAILALLAEPRENP